MQWMRWMSLRSKRNIRHVRGVLRRLQDNGFITSMENHFPRNNWFSSSSLFSWRNSYKSTFTFIRKDISSRWNNEFGKKSSLTTHRTQYSNKGKVRFSCSRNWSHVEVLQKCRDLFGTERVVSYHSRLSDGERANIFWGVRAGYYQVVVGSRSALFFLFKILVLWCLKKNTNGHLNLINLHDTTPESAEALAEIFRARAFLSSLHPRTMFRAQKWNNSPYSLPSSLALPPHRNCRYSRRRKKWKSGYALNSFWNTKTLAKGKQVLLSQPEGLFKRLKM